MRYIFFILLIFLNLPAFPNTDDLLKDLSNVLDQKDKYVSAKTRRIEKLKYQLGKRENNSPAKRYDQYLKILEEYKSFNNDSAFAYAEKLQNEAIILNDQTKINNAKLNFSFVLLSGGLFKETLEILNSLNVKNLNDSTKCEYYTQKARCYYDMASFVRNNHYGPAYDAKGHEIADSALMYTRKDTYAYYFIHGLKNLRLNNNEVAIDDYKKLINRKDLSNHQYAIIASTLSFLYSKENQGDESLRLLITSAIADVKSSTKENYALFKLSDALLKLGKVSEAYKFIRVALDDAQRYGARHRQFEVGILLPIIERQQLMLIEKQKSTIFTYAAIVTLLTLVIIAFIFTTIKQNRKLKSAQVILAEVNANLQQSNQALTEVNIALKEASRIKDEYIGYYFNINSEYIDKIERFKKSVAQRLTSGKYDEIKQIINKINLVKEREDLSLSFDRVFLKLFPNFVNEFNSLFEAEDRIHLPAGQLLNTELRIFALIRLGIHDNDRIAKILNFSVNTVYSYKTRIKNKSGIPNNEFEKRIMAIRAD